MEKAHNPDQASARQAAARRGFDSLALPRNALALAARSLRCVRQLREDHRMKISLAVSAALLCGADLPAAALARHPGAGTHAATVAAIRALEERWNREWAHPN